MMDEAVGGLIVAAATGLAFIAYKHPKGYGRIYYARSWAFVVGGFSVFGWSLAIGAAARAAETAGAKPNILAAIASANVPLWFGGGLFALAIYANLLRHLPAILKED